MIVFICNDYSVHRLFKMIRVIFRPIIFPSLLVVRSLSYLFYFIFCFYFYTIFNLDAYALSYFRFSRPPVGKDNRSYCSHVFQSYNIGGIVRHTRRAVLLIRKWFLRRRRRRRETTQSKNFNIIEPRLTTILWLIGSDIYHRRRCIISARNNNKVSSLRGTIYKGLGRL